MFFLKSFRPSTAPSGIEFSLISFTDGSMFQRIQWTYVFRGASLSSKSRARDLAPGGTFSIRISGFTLTPSHPYFEGIVLLFSKAGLVTFSGFAFPQSWLDPMDAEKIIE